MISSVGKRIRLNRLIQRETNTCIIFAIDHGLTSPCFFDGLYDTRARVRQAVAGGANVLMMGRGVAKDTTDEFRRDTSLALMLSASAAGRPSGAVVLPISSVSEAQRFGADAVVVYVALAGENEAEMIGYVSKIGEACEAEGMPFICEAEYPNAYQDLNRNADEFGVAYLLRNARLCAEMGADIIKVNWSGDGKSFESIVRACNRPVVLAGGSVISDEELLTRMQVARDAGAIGCSVGRNIFQHKDPEAITRAICRVFRDRWSAQQAVEELSETLQRGK